MVNIGNKFYVDKNTAVERYTFGWIDPRGIYSWVNHERDALDSLIEEALDIYISLEVTNRGNV